MRTRIAAATLIFAAPVLAACGAASGDDPQPALEVARGDAEVTVVDPADADLVLYVSNQSFDDSDVRLVVTVDGAVVVDDDFQVEGQHTWIEFNLAMPAGAHEVSATSDSGATLSETFQTPGTAPRYAVLDYWGEGSSAEFSWSVHRKPVAFG